MQTENLTFIRGSIDNVFELAANVHNWPTFLPHYRYVDVIEQSTDGCRRVITMSAVRENFPAPGLRFPVTWRSVQICEPNAGLITFKHIGGLATGMWVVWELTEDPWGRGVRVVIRHFLQYPLSIMNGWFAGDIVGNGFVSTIAGQTLARIKDIVETERKEISID